MKIVRTLIPIAILLLLLLGVGKYATGIYTNLTTVEQTNTVTETVYDTVRVEMPNVAIPKPTQRVVYVYKDAPSIAADNTIKALPIWDHTIVDDINVVDSIKANVYQDSLSVDGATLNYTHVVDGTLLASDYSIMYPKETVTNTITKTIHKKKYINIYSNTGARVGPYKEVYTGFDILVGDKWGVGITTGVGRFDDATKASFSISGKYNIFSF